MSVCFLIFSFLILQKVNADWEVLVCLGDRVDLLGNSGETVASRSLGLGTSSKPDILALDTLGGHLFLADSRHPNTSIFSLPLQLIDPPALPRPVVRKESRVVRGVAYDLVERAVYWTTGRERRIMRSMLPDPRTGSDTTLEIIHSFTKEVPHGIAIDSCRRKLYWSNCNMTGPSIEMSGLSGDDKQILVNKDLFQPLGLALSQGDGWLYWADEGSGYSFTVERIRLDGTERQVLVRSSHQQPVSLAVIPGEFVYWTDQLRQAVWKLDLAIADDSASDSSSFSDGASSKPVLVREYKESIPSGLVAMRQDSKLDSQYCSNIIKLKNQVGSWGANSLICPDEYCLHDGICTGGESLSCRCKAGYMGDRCQYESRLCSTYCLDAASVTDSNLSHACGCSNVSDVYNEVRDTLLGARSDGNAAKWRLVTLCLICLCIVLFVVTVILSVRTHTLSKRPKLRRRYTVNRGNPGIAGGQSTLDKNQCEIGDIENCCNMNICETPCYEPEFRTPGKISSKKSGIESRSLISDMEVPENSKPPCLF